MDYYLYNITGKNQRQKNSSNLLHSGQSFAIDINTIGYGSAVNQENVIGCDSIVVIHEYK